MASNASNKCKASGTSLKSSQAKNSAAVGRTSVNEAIEDENCGFCHKTVCSTDKAVLCEYCKLWFHISCESVPEGVYEYLGSRGVHWFCRGCDSKFSEMLRGLQKVEEQQQLFDRRQVRYEEDNKCLKERQDTLQEDFVGLREEIEIVKEGWSCLMSELEERLEKISENQTRVTAQVVPVTEGNTGNVGIGLTRREVVEQIERDKRKMNLMVMGIKEGDREEDVVNSIIDKLGGVVEEGDISSIERVGKRVDDKNRPIRVSFRNSELRAKLLKKKVELRGTTLKDLYLSPDLTPQQQVFDKTLRDKFKKLQTEGVDNIKIKNGTIVKNVSGKEEIIFPSAQTQ